MIKLSLYGIKLNLKRKKNIDTIKELEIELFKIKYSKNPNRLQNASKKLNKSHVIDKNLQEIFQEVSLDYVGEFEMVGKSNIGDQIRTTHIRFGNITDYEAYINAIDQDYESGDAIFNG